jgi:hypothetical protein
LWLRAFLRVSQPQYFGVFNPNCFPPLVPSSSLLLGHFSYFQEVGVSEGDSGKSRKLLHSVPASLPEALLQDSSLKILTRLGMLYRVFSELVELKLPSHETFLLNAVASNCSVLRPLKILPHASLAPTEQTSEADLPLLEISLDSVEKSRVSADFSGSHFYDFVFDLHSFVRDFHLDSSEAAYQPPRWLPSLQSVPRIPFCFEPGSTGTAMHSPRAQQPTGNLRPQGRGGRGRGGNRGQRGGNRVFQQRRGSQQRRANRTGIQDPVRVLESRTVS